jgi:translin
MIFKGNRAFIENMENLEKNPQLTGIFERIRGYLDQMDSLREQLLPLQRGAVRSCSEVIKKIHRREFEGIPELLNSIRAQMHSMRTLVESAPGELSADYLSIVQQEFGEATLLYALSQNQPYPTPEDLSIGLLEYAYACADLVGELRRATLDALRNEDLDKATHYLAEMDELHGHLFSLDYPKGLIPGLRAKIDQARNILARTESDIAVSANILKLNKNLVKLNQTGGFKLPEFENDN